MKIRALLLSAAMLSCATMLVAQRVKEPKRPHLPAASDTNNAHAYYDFALNRLRKDPDEAADALYWSTRIDPSWADGFYARRVALLLGDTRRLINYWNGDKRTIQSDDIKRIDSLYFHALTLNPFVSQAIDKEIFEAVANEIAKRYERAGEGDAGSIRFAMDREMASAPAATRAWLAYGDGRFGEALELYAEAIKDDKRNGPLHIDRGRVFYRTGAIDSAVTELTLAMNDLRTRDKKELIYVYQSKALTEQSIGIAQLRLGHADAAKEAFGQALQEDLSYAPAHMQLAYMALDAKDTATALTEFDLAVQVRGDDPVSRYVYGFTLAAQGKNAEAEVQLKKAVELDPWYALPHFGLGVVLEARNDAADAAKQFNDFLSLASATDPRRAYVKGRVQALTAAPKP